MSNILNSEKLFAAALKVIPGGVNSPVRAFKAVGGTPRFIQSAKGSRMIDVDGNSYIDYVGSWGPMIAGHNHPHVIAAVKAAVEDGLSFGAPTEREVTLATLICKLMPSIEQVRLVNSGTEATMSAIRLARAYTKRSKIIKFAGCYHGHSDSFLIKAGSGALTLGIPNSPGVTPEVAADTVCAPYNDLAAVQQIISQHPNEIAAIIVEPIAGNMNFVPGTPEFMHGLRTLCTEHGIVLIFDEVMTGFRVGLGGAQAHYGIKADLTTLGKIIGGGMPVGAFGGSMEIMQMMAPAGPVYQAGTLSGNPISTAAGLANLELVQKPGFYEELSRKTQILCKGIEEAARAHDIPCSSYSIGGMFGIFFTDLKRIHTFDEVMACDTPRYNEFFHHMLDEGVYLAPAAYEAGFTSGAHSDEDIQLTINAAAKAFEKIRSGQMLKQRESI